MVIHPPMLYMGYVGFSVAFSFAVAALIGGNLDATWARWTRPWTTAAWIFLTLGIALGSWLGLLRARLGRLVVLGSGRERLVHALAGGHRADPFARRHREARQLQVWTVLLAILAFSLSLLGTFLVRSGVLSSVHAFATDPRRGLFILAFLVVVIGGSLALYAWRAPKVGLGARFALLSRETLLLGNNVLLLVACGAVLLGTLYPLALDALGMGKISVGPPYFDTVFVPLMAPLVFLMGIGPLARWKQAELPDLASRLQWAAGAAVVATLLDRCGCAAASASSATVGLLMAFWIVASIATDLRRAARGRPAACAPACCSRARLTAALDASACMLAHLGIAVVRLRRDAW